MENDNKLNNISENKEEQNKVQIQQMNESSNTQNQIIQNKRNNTTFTKLNERVKTKVILNNIFIIIYNF